MLKILLRVLAVTEIQQAHWLLDEIQQQPSVFVVSGPATGFRQPVRFSLMDGRLNLSRVVRTARTRQDNNLKERASHAFYSHIHGEVTICDTFPATAQGPDEGEYPTENTIP